MNSLIAGEVFDRINTTRYDNAEIYLSAQARLTKFDWFVILM